MNSHLNALQKTRSTVKLTSVNVLQPCFKCPTSNYIIQQVFLSYDVYKQVLMCNALNDKSLFHQEILLQAGNSSEQTRISFNKCETCQHLFYLIPINFSQNVIRLNGRACITKVQYIAKIKLLLTPFSILALLPHSQHHTPCPSSLPANHVSD